MSNANSVRTLLNVASLATNVLSEQSEGSLIEYTQPTQNTILVTVEDQLTHHAIVPEILKFCTNIYTGYYLTAVALMNNVGNCNVRQTLDRLNTNRNVGMNAKDGIQEWMSIESYLDYPIYHKRPSFETQSVSLEAFGERVDKIGKHIAGKIQDGDNQTMDSDGKTSDLKWVTDMPHLAQGKIFEVVIADGDKKAVIPATVRLDPVACNKEMFKAMYARANQNNNWLSRLHRWMDGELSTISDMIFVNDIISDYARLLKQDKLKLTEQLEKKRRGNRLSTILTQKTSLATASTITVLAKSTIPDIELAVGGRIDNPKVRADIFARSGLIMMVIVDDMYEIVTLYYRNQARKMDLTFSECKTASKGNGPDVMEILRAFQAGQVPNI